MAKDKLYGGIILAVAAFILVIFTVYSVVDLWLETNGAGIVHPEGVPPLLGTFAERLFDWRFFIVVPIWLLVTLIMIIAIWIGYSMLTTPPPVPLEELEEELEAQEAAAEKKEE